MPSHASGPTPFFTGASMGFSLGSNGLILQHSDLLSPSCSLRLQLHPLLRGGGGKET